MVYLSSMLEIARAGTAIMVFVTLAVQLSMRHKTETEGFLIGVILVISWAIRKLDRATFGK